MMSNVEDEHLETLQKIGHKIKTFDKQRQLKRSQTFDHSSPSINDASLKLTLSIQHFDKEKSLKKAHTLDRTSSRLKALEHSMSIQHFDFHSLKHVESVDKSSPLHIYSLTRSFSCYSNYSDTPTEEEAKDIQGGNSEFTEISVTQKGDNSVIEEETLEENDENMQKDNSELIDKIVEENNHQSDQLEVDSEVITVGSETKVQQSCSDNTSIPRQVLGSSAEEKVNKNPSSLNEDDKKLLAEIETDNSVELEDKVDDLPTEILEAARTDVSDENVICTYQCDTISTSETTQKLNYADREGVESRIDEIGETNISNLDNVCDMDSTVDCTHSIN